MEKKKFTIDNNMLAANIAKEISLAIFDKITKNAERNKGDYLPSTFDLYNLAFACELFLKIILSENNIKVNRNHKLKTLFDSLNKPIKNTITEIYNSGPTINKNKPNFIEALAKSSNSFIRYRYIYENIDKFFANRKEDTEFLMYFVKALDDYLRITYVPYYAGAKRLFKKR